VDLLRHDVGHEPGALPLLSHALFETWQRRRARTMTMSGYSSSGGVRGAIAETAEAVFSDQFNEKQQEIARRIFLRLTELGDENASSDTRRRATFEELILKPEEASTTQAVLKALADARLISTSEDSAEVAHEALIREWPTLRGWLESNREGLRVHRHLTEAAQEWLASGRNPELLYRAGRLVQALEWRLDHPEEINTLESEFLEASEHWLEQESAEKEAQRRQQLEAAQKLAQAESQRAEEQAGAALRLRRRALYLASALVVAVGMGLAALFFATRARQAVLTEQSQQRIAFSRELAAASTSNLDVDPERSLLLSREAVSTTYTVDKTWTKEAEQALHNALLASRLELTLRGHTDSVVGVAFSPDGKQIGTASEDGTVRIWDSEKGQELSILMTNATHGRPGITFSPDGKQVAAIAGSNNAGIWDAATGRQLIILQGHTDWVSGIAFSPDGKRVATASEDRTARVWDATDGRELLVLRGHSAAVWDIAFSPDGKIIATAGEEGWVKLWETDSGTLRATILAHRAPVNSVAFSPDGQWIATAGGDRTAKIWNAATGSELLVLRGHTDFVSRVDFSPDGTRLATSGGDGTARIWDTLTGQELLSLKGHTAPVTGVAFDPICPAQEQTLTESCGARLATASWDGTAKIWNISLNRELLTLSTRDAPVRAFSADGRRLAAGYMDGAVRMWDISGPLGQALGKNEAISEAPDELLKGSAGEAPIHAITFSPDGTLLAAASEDGTTKVWGLKEGAELFTLQGHTASVETMAFSKDGTHLVTAGLDYTVKVWDLRQPDGGAAPIQSISLANWCFAVAFSPDGNYVATGTNDGIAKVWDITAGKEVLSLRGHSGPIWGISFNADGTRLATASDDSTVIIWDVVKGKEWLRLGGHTGPVNALAYNVDGSRLATASQDGTVKLWDNSSGRELLSLPGNATAVMGIAFSSDGARLSTASDDGLARYYLLGMQDLLVLAQERTTRQFSVDECLQYLHRSDADCAQYSTPAAPAAEENITGDVVKPATGKSKACLVIDEAGVRDEFYNQMTYEGIKSLEQEFGWETAIFESRGPADYDRQMASSLSAGCSLIITPNPFGFSDLTRTAASTNPELKFLIMETSYDTPLDNLRVEEYATDQAAFLAGYTAASVTRTGKVGTFGGVNFPGVTIFMDGYARGIAYHNKVHGTQVELLGWDMQKRDGLFVGNFDSIEAGYFIGKDLIKQGADIILPVAGQVGLGTATAAQETTGVYVIGVDTDWAVTYPEFADVILTSIQKRMDTSVLTAVEAIQEGDFTGGQHPGTLENRGVGLAPFHSLDGIVSPETKKELENITAEIISGNIDTR
jgi:WD40 repeat protein/basic membrane lipoprotein Med (substrate-binding protein (PBP1-ABC) superfamily)